MTRPSPPFKSVTPDVNRYDIHRAEDRTMIFALSQDKAVLRQAISLAWGIIIPDAILDQLDLPTITEMILPLFRRLGPGSDA